MMKNVIVTCPPMLGLLDQYHDKAKELGIRLHRANVTQTLTEDELCDLVPNYDGWIIGDDPATRKVFETAKSGKLTAAVKWGIGVDNVDFNACKELDIPITNTPNMFGEEVADIATAYVISLARELFAIDRGVRSGEWPKPPGISLRGRTVGIVGFGDIGTATAKRMLALGLNVIVYDPYSTKNTKFNEVELVSWPSKVETLDFLVFTCSLNDDNYHMLDCDVINQCKQGVRIINVARGALIDEDALCVALESGHVHSAALDVFEIEPLDSKHPLRGFNRCIFGSHNGSNTFDAVSRASINAIISLSKLLN